MEVVNGSRLSNSSMGEEEEAAQGKLLPTLLQIFLTVFLGWLSGTLGIFGTREAKGLGIFVSKYSLPALIFISLASLNISDIKWSFLLAILVSKSIIFITVLMVDLLLNRNMSRAALFAIYSTQTNDFGIGLPILSSVYSPDHPLVGLLYLVAPISLLILNPIGFVMLEVDKDRGKEERGSVLTTVLGVLRGLLTNPVVVMTVLGVLGNIVFSSSPPPHLAKFLTSLGSAFSALAPFSLGLGMVNKLAGLRGESTKPIAALVATKTIVTPLLTYMMVERISVLLDGVADPSLTNFALLLGSFPTALGVASYASDYMVSADLISGAIVLGTVTSAPMLYLVANILSALAESAETLAQADHSCLTMDCVLSILSAVIVLALFVSRPSWRQSPHLLSLSILVLTLASSTAGLLHAFVPSPYLALLHLTALHASRLSTPGLAILLLIRARGSTALSSPLASLLLILSGPLLSLPSLLLLLTPYTPYHFVVFGPWQDHLSLAVNAAALLPLLPCLLLLSLTRPSPSLSSLQLSRHSLLLLSLATAMFTSLSFSLGRLLLPGPTYPGAFIALTCINALLSSGQAILFLAVFGLDQSAKLLIPLKNLWEAALSSSRETSSQACRLLAKLAEILGLVLQADRPWEKEEKPKIKRTVTDIHLVHGGFV